MRAGYRPLVLSILLPAALIVLLAGVALAADRVVLGEVFSGVG